MSEPVVPARRTKREQTLAKALTRSEASERLVLTVKQAGEMLGLASSSVYKMVDSGELPVIQVSGEWRVRPADLFKAIDQRKTAEETGDRLLRRA